MTARALMFQGTGSDVGKSVIVAGLCRLASNRGLRVAPFKPQNMSNNAAVCSDGGEIGRAQALQARACRLPLSVHFNPVLLKPQSDKDAQVVVHGRAVEVQPARQYMQKKRMSLLPRVLESFDHLKQQYDLVLIEGAGSAAEVNLREGDIANMGFARAADIPVCIIADIDRGGVIASLAGTHAILGEEDRRLIQSFIINKFRGDPSLFDEGLEFIQNYTGWRSEGVIPWLPVIRKLPQEDAVPLERSLLETNTNDQAMIRIAAPMLPRIANFDDLDPLKLEPGVEVIFVPPGKAIPIDVDAVILLGTKSAIADLRFLREQGWHHEVQSLARAGKTILGICGGYQMLGTELRDPAGYDGQPGMEAGLGLLDVETTMRADKTSRQNHGHHHEAGHQVSGYEIHSGKTTGADTVRPYLTLETGPDGAVAENHRIYGTYLHGLFTSDGFRGYWLKSLRSDFHVDSSADSFMHYEATVDRVLDELASDLEKHLDVDSLLASAC
ncbi:MAG: cobyric acid synthase [Gammaproteobacteria bacterium]|jgi:adenosylcobyric acid synthase|nr:cobyric acid synthase [Gammaproteobacteria bacterium]MBT4491779.1 cobyric acid synthase [Gammaproteobacteria bacterium]MBT7372204.1 cobyric acid synthase [Gammaproteobacteria bacterium]